MNRSEFITLMDRQYANVVKIFHTKGNDYAGDQDALSNFTEMAETLRLTPEQVWAVYAAKHWSAVMTYCREGDVKSEPIDGRIDDAVLYLLLLKGLVVERRQREAERKEIPF